jgi:hypothetical protein
MPIAALKIKAEAAAPAKPSLFERLQSALARQKRRALEREELFAGILVQFVPKRRR